jgi:lysophospholipase L1-like esterase
MGESIGLVGSIPELGQWDVIRCTRLRTSGDRYPLWWVDLDIQPSLEASLRQRIEYKYVRLGQDGQAQWESLGANRWVPIEAGPLPSTLIVDDGNFGCVQPWPYGYWQEPIPKMPFPKGPQGLNVVVIGSSVAWGCSAWLLQGWTWHLEQALYHHYGHQLINASEIGANVTRTIARFPQVVVPQRPDIVIVALSLGNEGMAYSPPSQRREVQQRFETGLQTLVQMIRDIGARPILGGVYPHGDYTLDHYWLLQETHNRMLSWGVPVLNWLAALDNGRGRWRSGLSFDVAHPNTEGHRRMFDAIDLGLFQPDPQQPSDTSNPPSLQTESLFCDRTGFQLVAVPSEKRLHINNPSPYAYVINPDWNDLQTALRQKATLTPGIYIGDDPATAALSFLAIQDDGAIATTIAIPPAADLTYRAALSFFAQTNPQIIFHNDDLGILKDGDRLYVINESDHEYNIHPMWKEVRSALKAVPPGVYEDPQHPDTRFRTMMIGDRGLESRVKAPPKSLVLFQYRCPLADISRVAIIPLGDRCAVRMLLYKMEYDGPAFPFDLTRTTNLADVADMIESQFYDMWNPSLLHYNHDARRIYHTKWTGLSFAHEVEESDDPLSTLQPVYDRMKARYTARAERFWYTIRHADKILFVRTGLSDRGTVSDLVAKLDAKCQGRPFRLLLISPQPSGQFSNLPNVLHYDLEFNPDRMYEDLGHWLYCTEMMRGILESLGVSSKNLFWCPPNPVR